MSRRIDLTGKKFGKLLVIENVGSNKYKKAMWKCRCDCGEEVVVIGSNLIRGNSKSCGCNKHTKAVNRSDISGKRFGR